MFNIRGIELIVLLVLALLIFGPSKIPALAKSIGTAISQFKEGLNSAKNEIGDPMADSKSPDPGKSDGDRG